MKSPLLISKYLEAFGRKEGRKRKKRKRKSLKSYLTHTINSNGSLVFLESNIKSGFSSPSHLAPSYLSCLLILNLLYVLSNPVTLDSLLFLANTAPNLVWFFFSAFSQISPMPGMFSPTSASSFLPKTAQILISARGFSGSPHCNTC